MIVGIFLLLYAITDMQLPKKDVISRSYCHFYFITIVAHIIAIVSPYHSTLCGTNQGSKNICASYHSLPLLVLDTACARVPC